MRLCCMRTRRASLHGGDIGTRLVIVLAGGSAVLHKSSEGCCVRRTGLHPVSAIMPTTWSCSLFAMCRTR